MAKKDGRVIAVAPTSALRASLIRKQRGNESLLVYVVIITTLITV